MRHVGFLNLSSDREIDSVFPRHPVRMIRGHTNREVGYKRGLELQMPINSIKWL